jgi:hypothetical protein
MILQSCYLIEFYAMNYTYVVAKLLYIMPVRPPDEVMLIFFEYVKDLRIFSIKLKEFKHINVAFKRAP